MNYVLAAGFVLLDAGWVPDAVTRYFARRLLRTERLAEIARNGVERQQELEEAFIEELKRHPTIAIETELANKQHYEVPSEFFLHVLGPRLKYSACEFHEGWTLKEAENATFEMYGKRAELADGMSVLDLGCGWGSLSLWLLATYPNMRVTAVSNSATQKQFIEAQAASKGFTSRLTVHTANINTFDLEDKFDRIMSIEMFEHCKNYQKLFAKLAKWLRVGGALFVHIFTYDHHSYHFEAKDETDWMAEHFFSGGTMPHHELLQRFQTSQLVLQRKWKQNGLNYARTLEAWLQRMDAQTEQIKPIFAKCYGPANVQTWISRWRTFFLACSELFHIDNGNRWYVTHYLFRRE